MRIANSMPVSARFLTRSSLTGATAALLAVMLVAAPAARADNNAAAALMQPAPDMTASMPSGGNDSVKPEHADITKNVSDVENKLSTNAKNLVKHLDDSSEAMTLEDLNSARQTIARIDAVIEVEKRLAELDKLRNERSEAKNPPVATAAIAAAIPASALTPPPAIVPITSSTPYIAPRPAEKHISSVEISRISGTDGRYVALLKTGNGDLKAVRVGDVVSSGVTVRSITASSVGLEEGSESRTLHIKNVDAVYSALR